MTISKTINKDSYIILDTINQLENISSFKSEFLIGILNSKLISWYAYRFIFCMAIKTMHFDNSVTSRIPIPNIMDNKGACSLAIHDIPDIHDIHDTHHIHDTHNIHHINDNYDRIVSLVDQMLESQKLYHNSISDSDKNFYKQKIDIIDKQIDNLVYKIYGLTDEEIKIVDEEQ